MIPHKTERTLASSGVEASGNFALSQKDSVHIMGILRDTLYSDKVLAPMREYSANAWDANRMGGKPNKPIKVTMPTWDMPTLAIRDFGPGLSRDDVFSIYTQYGASTKRDSNEAVGALGIGSKSAFAYTDSFQVTSFHGGKKAQYVAAIDPTGVGVINLLAEEDCDPADTGVLIEIGVRNEDIHKFEERARQLFQYFEPRPEINLDLPAPPNVKAVYPSGVVHETWRNGEWYARMGCLAYEIDRAQLPHGLAFADKASGVLRFEIGELAIAASREALRYSPETIKALTDKFEAITTEYVQGILNTVDGDEALDWDKRLALQALKDFLPRASTLARPDLALLLRTVVQVPPVKPTPEAIAAEIKSVQTINEGRLKEIADLVAAGKTPLPHQMELAVVAPPLDYYCPENLKFVGRDFSTKQRAIGIGEHVRLIIDNDPREKKGFSLSHGDVIVKSMSRKEKAHEELLGQLFEFCVVQRILGIPVGLLSDVPWSQPYHRKPLRSEANPKHRSRSFRLLDQNSYSDYHRPASDYWEAVVREPTAQDVYITLEEYATSWGFFRNYMTMRALARGMGVPVPEIYGYKNTPKRPVDVSKLPGLEYRDWLKEFDKTIFASQKIIDDIRLISWRQEFHYYHEAPKEYRKELPADNLLIKVFDASKKAFDDKKIPDGYSDALTTLSDRPEYKKIPNDANLALEALYTAYPLLEERGVEGLHDRYVVKGYIHYIKTVDELTELKAKMAASKASRPRRVV